MPPLRLPMLDRGATYRITQLAHGGAGHPWGSAPLLDAIQSPDGAVVHGAWLAEAGLPLPRTQAEHAHILRLQRV
jgi:alpha-galactosidase